MKNKTLKKTLSLFIALLMLAALIFSFSSFMIAKAEENDTSKNYEAYTLSFDGQTEERIKEDYLDFRSKNKAFLDVPFVSGRFIVDDVMIEEYYGPFDGAWVLYIEIKGEGYPEVIYDDIVAGYKFVHPNAVGYVVWKNGNMYTLPEAYEQNVISDDDLRVLAQLSKKTLETPDSTEPSGIGTSSTTEPQRPSPVTQPSTTPKTGDNGNYYIFIIIPTMIFISLFAFTKTFFHIRGEK